MSIIGEPGSYDPSVYDDIEGGDNECVWIENILGHLPGVSIQGFRVSHGDPVPAPGDGDVFILGGSYNSVHDGFPWQTVIYRWLETLRASAKPLLAICGGHQMICHMAGVPVEPLPDGFIAGTEPVTMTDQGRASPLFKGLDQGGEFHFANQEHATETPSGARLLASHERAPVAALDHGEGWFSTQFHPEATVQTIGSSWRVSHPERVRNYREITDGLKLIKNFLDIAGQGGRV